MAKTGAGAVVTHGCCSFVGDAAVGVDGVDGAADSRMPSAGTRLVLPMVVAVREMLSILFVAFPQGNDSATVDMFVGPFAAAQGAVRAAVGA